MMDIKIDEFCPQSEGYSYLVSPYSHPDPAVRESRHTCACLACVSIYFRFGEVVYSPVTHWHMIAKEFHLDPTFSLWRRNSIEMLKHACIVRVLTLPGWQESVGVRDEIAEADQQGIPVRYHSLGQLILGEVEKEEEEEE